MRFPMGFYECIYDCGNGYYCVDCASSLDGFQSPPSFLIVCPKHQLVRGQTWEKYLMKNFISKYIKRDNNIVWKTHYKVKLLDFIPYKNFHLVKLEVEDFDISGLDETKRVYFSQFSDEPAWTSSNGKTICIDAFTQNNIVRTTNTNPSVCYDWKKNQVRPITLKEKQEWEETWKN